MPRRNNNKRRFGNRKGNNSVASTSNINTVQRALSNKATGSNEIVTRVGTIEGAITTTMGGAYTGVIGFTPSAYTGWAAFSTEYDEWRVVGAEIKIFSISSSSNIGGFVVVVYDNDDATTALSSYVAGMDYRQKIQFPAIWTGGNAKTMRVNCYSVADKSSGRAWATTANATANPCSFKFYATGLSGTVGYWVYTIQIVMQFRGPI